VGMSIPCSICAHSLRDVDMLYPLCIERDQLDTMVHHWSRTVVNAAQYKAAEAAIILALNDNAKSSLPAPSDSNGAMILPVGKVCCSHFVDEVTCRSVIYHSISCVDDCTQLCSC
jgi:hypothetical protein